MMKYKKDCKQEKFVLSITRKYTCYILQNAFEDYIM